MTSGIVFGPERWVPNRRASVIGARPYVFRSYLSHFEESRTLAIIVLTTRLVLFDDDDLTCGVKIINVTTIKAGRRYDDDDGRACSSIGRPKSYTRVIRCRRARYVFTSRQPLRIIPVPTDFTPNVRVLYAGQSIVIRRYTASHVN